MHIHYYIACARRSAHSSIGFWRVDQVVSDVTLTSPFHNSIGNCIAIGNEVTACELKHAPSKPAYCRPLHYVAPRFKEWTAFQPATCSTLIVSAASFFSYIGSELLVLSDSCCRKNVVYRNAMKLAKLQLDVTPSPWLLHRADMQWENQSPGIGVIFAEL